MKQIAVLGGGLSGLSAAFHLSRRFPESIIRVFEKSNHVGGWVRSERVTVTDARGETAHITVEAGPRTIRPNGKAMLELIHLLGLHDSLITVPKSAPAAQHRFLHIHELPGIQRIPATLLSLLLSPLRHTLTNAVVWEPFRKANRPKGITDESVDSLLSRRFGDQFARTFGSALVHGVYAADSRNLSVRAAFPSIWDAEERGKGSILRGFMTRAKTPSSSPPEYALGNLPILMKDVSVFSFKDGMSTLTTALRSYLDKTNNVTVHDNTRAVSLNGTTLQLSTGKDFKASHIVSAIPLHLLNNVVPQIPHLTVNPASSVTVMNLIFPGAPSSIHPPGFGYLIPRPVDGYASPSNPGMLGVVFDSCSLSSQDSSAAFTKLTVMLGGPHPNVADLDSVLLELEHQLGIEKLPKPVYTKVHRHVECIPTLTPGHLERMNEMRKMVRNRWAGRVQVIGAGVSGVSLNDCVEAGRNVGKEW